MVMHPVGPLAPATYWRRRALLLALLVVLVLVLRSCVGGDDPKRTAGAGNSPTPTHSVTRTVAPSTAPSPARPNGPVTCSDAALRLTTRTDARSYATDVRPRITLTVTNVSRSTCRRDLGGRALEVLVYSGEDRIWSSDDCSTDTTAAVQTLKAGQVLESTVTWARTRSAKGCPTGRPEARPGTYVVRARLGTLQGERTAFQLAG